MKKYPDKYGKSSQAYHTLILLLLACAGIFSPVLSQENDLLTNRELFFSQNTWSLALGTFASGAKTVNTTGSLKLNTGLGIGFYAGVRYIANFNERIGFETGFSLGAIPLRYNYYLAPEVSGEEWDHTWYTTEYIQHIQSPVLVNFRQRYKDKILLRFKIGTNIRYIVLGGSSANYGFIDDNGRDHTSLDINNRFNNSFTLSPALALGFSRFFNNYTSINLDVIYNHSYTSIFSKSRYVFPDHSGTGRYFTEGRFESKGSYLGVEVSYTFSGIRKILRQAKRGR